MPFVPHTKRGRPPKFGKPAQVVALTLPHETVRGLRRVHPDLAWAIVTLSEKRTAAAGPGRMADAELVSVGHRQSLIVVNRDVFKRLPGVSIIPLSGNRAFLALAPEQGLADLEVAALDRLDAPSIDPRERKALKAFRDQLKRWRRDRGMKFHTRGIIIAERSTDVRANASDAKRRRTLR